MRKPKVLQIFSIILTKKRKMTRKRKIYIVWCDHNSVLQMKYRNNMIKYFFVCRQIFLCFASLYNNERQIIIIYKKFVTCKIFCFGVDYCWRIQKAVAEIVKKKSLLLLLYTWMIHNIIWIIINKVLVRK